MDDERSHYLIMLGDVCVAARIASLSVEVLTADGTRLSGVPAPQTPDADAEAVDDTGYANDLFIGGQCVPLDTVVEFVVRTPRL